MATDNTAEINEPSANIGCLYAAKSNKGSSNLNWRYINNAIPIAPMIMVPYTEISDQPAVLAELHPYSKAPKPMVE
ncbi:hypothetical protein D3C81_1319890 [compost metagenome]